MAGREGRGILVSTFYDPQNAQGSTVTTLPQLESIPLL
jgi:hypothetical protein